MTRAVLCSAFLAVCFGFAGGCTDEPASDPDHLVLKTGDFEIPIGDSFTCFYTDVTTDRELSVGGATGTQGLGGHHILAYYAEQPRPVGNHPCTDEEMTNLHQIAGAAGNNNEAPPIEFRDNLALKVPAGKQLVMQAHYINVTDSARTVNDSVTLSLVKPEDVFAYLNYFVTNDDSFELPPSAAYSHTTYCTTQRDLQIVLTLGHMHENGQHYKLEVVDGVGTNMQTLRDDDWAPSYASHPLLTYYPVSQPLLLPAGTRFRQTCDWQNDTTHTVIFPREMCLAFMYFFPGDGNDIVCHMEPQ